jgi:tRNA (cytidine/uridine-2'-O-)-methyltransferase
MTINLALYQPEIAQNVGAAFRLCACLGIPVDIIEPTAFPWDDARIRRSAMDYIDYVTIHRHKSWDAFASGYHDRRIILLTTKSTHSYLDFTFQDGDILLAGQESAGVPPDIHDFCEHRLTIPMAHGPRSLNIVNACAMVVGEALRQLR